MPGLTAAQLILLKNDILADPVLVAKPNTNDGNSEIAAAYGVVAVPDFWVWRTRVAREELVNSVGPDGTTFSWTGAGYITRSQGERDAFREMFGAQGVVNPSLANVRAAFVDIFSGGTAPAPANRTHLAAVSRRLALRVEMVLASGAGSTASPAVMGYEGTINYDDVAAARAS